MTDSSTDAALDFERAQYSEDKPAALTCRGCQKVLEGSYHSLNGQPICGACLAAAKQGGEGSFFKALGLGLLAGAVGALGYYAIRTVTGYDLALVTIVVGIMVGLAVRKGAGLRQSVIYRILAVGLTYVAMCSTYVPIVAEGIAGAGQAEAATKEPAPEASAARTGDSGAKQVVIAVVASVIALGVPFFLIGNAEILALLIFGFGLWEAWRLSAAKPFVVEGPFEVEAPPKTDEAAPALAPSA